MKISLPNAITSRAGRAILVSQKHSPQFLFYGGLALAGATVVSACRGTLKLEDVLDDIKQDRDDITQVTRDNPKYSERDVRKLNYYTTGKGIARIAKLYLPSMALGVAAVGCLTTSHNQLTRRNAGLSAALVATERALEKYRDRVRNDVGEKKELELWRGEHDEVVPVLDDEGRETKSKTKTRVGGGQSPYARLWGQETSNEWDPQPEYNLAKLRSVQEWGTIMVNSRGHLFLNEIFDQLGLSHTPAGAVCGWKSQKYGGRDGYVDFGVIGREGEDQVKFLEFVTGREAHIWLDFNVDGEIWRDI